MKTTFALVIASLLIVTATATTAFAASKPKRIIISYEPTKDPDLKEVRKEMKRRKVLEKLQVFLSPFRLPRILSIKLAGCDGEDDAFYGDDAVTICYELIDELDYNRPKKRTPAGIEPIDTVIGPIFSTTLHEFAHALFDMHKIPILGKEEDAADQVSAYILLQLGKVEAHRIIAGTAYAFFAETKETGKTPSVSESASEHGTPAQRAFNILCIAYGADTKLFADALTKGHLPKDRAERCEEEYEQVQDAMEILIGPYIDRKLAEKILDRDWLRTADKK